MTRRRHPVSSAWSPIALGVAIALLSCTPAHAAAGDEEDLSLAYGDTPLISLATGSPQTLTRAPAVGTVITAEDIAAMGATDLDDVLEAVPGLYVGRSTQGFTPTYSLRGIQLGLNPQVLMLIDGVPATVIYTGNRGNIWGGFPLDHVERIEVIRGPGSALYGTEAMAGVIHIITKTGSQVGGTRAGVRAGSFNTGDVWLQHGGHWAGAELSAYLRLGATEGGRQTVDADAQSGIDALMGTSLSRAPGPVDNQRSFVDLSLAMQWPEWHWRFAVRDRSNVGSGTGVASALDPDGDSGSQFVSTELGWERRQAFAGWDAQWSLSASHYREYSKLTLYPAGTPDALGQPFEDGLIGNPAKWERHVRLSGSIQYHGMASHRWRLGAGVARESVYKTAESKNFNPDFTRIGTGSLADVTDVSDSVPFMTPHGRTRQFVYVQDEWAFQPDWTLTAGVRHDHHSDFGDATNPRLALVWEASYNLTAKWLYGTAFRAPSISELYAINNPVVQGNPALSPERIRTAEASLTWQATPACQWQVSVFAYQIDDLIRLVNGTYANTGAQTGRGLELEMRWDVTPQVRLSGHFSHQRATDRATGEDAGNAPENQLYARLDWAWGAGWSAHGQVNWFGNQPRTPGDAREPMTAFGTLDVTLRHEPFDEHWSTMVTVRNLLDADARTPSPNDRVDPIRPFVSLPHDFPLPGRSVMVQVSRQF